MLVCGGRGARLRVVKIVREAPKRELPVWQTAGLFVENEKLQTENNRSERTEGESRAHRWVVLFAAHPLLSNSIRPPLTPQSQL